MKKKAKQVKRSALSLTAKSKVKQTKSDSIAIATKQDEMVWHLDPKRLTPSKYNERPIDEKSDRFKELLNSVAQVGVTIPVIARPMQEDTEQYELICGKRRLRAAELAGHKTIPVIVRKMNDVEAANLIFVENFFRDDLTIMQTAKQLKTQLERNNGDHKAVADILGKPESWVHRVVNVADNLIEGWIKALEKGGPVLGTWSLGHIELIARFPAEKQNELLDDLEDDPYFWEDLTVADLRKKLEDDWQTLKSADWGLDEQMKDDQGELPKCSECSKRTGFKPMLFDDGSKSKGDRCLDPECWKRKSIAFRACSIEKIKSKHPGVVLLGNSSYGIPGVTVSSPSNYVPAKKDALLDVIEGKRPYDENKGLDFMVFLKGIVRSEVYHLATSVRGAKERYFIVSETDQTIFEESLIPGDEPEPPLICINRELIKKLKTRLKEEEISDPMIYKILECYDAEITKPQDIAEVLSISVKEVNNIQKRFRRTVDHMKDIKKEYCL